MIKGELDVGRGYDQKKEVCGADQTASDWGISVDADTEIIHSLHVIA